MCGNGAVGRQGFLATLLILNGEQGRQLPKVLTGRV